LNECGIREDLEHIHNLVVISVAVSKGDIYISTNSVHNALFARTCMISRSLYKGLKIEWYPDECASPLPCIQEKLIAPHHPPIPGAQLLSEVGKRNAKSSNLYALLDMDEAEESDVSVDEEDDLQSHVQPGYSDGVGINWADSMIVA
jgi:hypothetical protein